MDQVEIFNKEEILEYFKTDLDQTMRIVELTLILHLQSTTVSTEHA